MTEMVPHVEIRDRMIDERGSSVWAVGLLVDV